MSDQEKDMMKEEEKEVKELSDDELEDVAGGKNIKVKDGDVL